MLMMNHSHARPFGTSNAEGDIICDQVLPFPSRALICQQPITTYASVPRFWDSISCMNGWQADRLTLFYVRLGKHSSCNMSADKISYGEMRTEKQQLVPWVNSIRRHRRTDRGHPASMRGFVSCVSSGLLCATFAKSDEIIKRQGITSSCPSTVCAAYINTCSQMYGGCYAACSGFATPTFSPPPCVTQPRQEHRFAGTSISCGSTVCADYINSCGLRYGGCYAACSGFTKPSFTPPPCPTTTQTFTPTVTLTTKVATRTSSLQRRYWHRTPPSELRSL
ncbi:hypothetical protein D0860_03163 [Hortaea werneckii]|uniref:Uncharacterized protein n=1 Tax=Hortaea werneckii TaxID=91943 RepID=A0A3M7HFF5_HORWE|nr:hypothetical protein D0860_03163 [Hortaea werneckii]RMZ32833.1 hypothetical protein D0859_03026 [Hortaea werneckii]